MYIRRVETGRRRKAPGQKYHTFRLAHSVRTGQHVRQVPLLTLGSKFPVPERDWPALLALVDDLRAHQPPLLPPDPALLPWARRIVAHLKAIDFDPDAAPDHDLATVHLDSVRNSGARSVGGERLALHACERLGLPDALRGCGLSDRDARIALSLLVARMLQPGSEHATHRWLSGTSAAWELLDLDGRPPSLQKLYRVGDQLWKHREPLEGALFARERELLGLPRTIVFYDLTNVHYHGPARGDLQRGRSKQKRHDCPLMTLALSLDGAGFPRRSQVLPGNVSEPGTLQAALRQLEALPGADAERPTVVMDAGLSTAANIAWLRAQGYAWITVQRGRAERPEREPDMRVQTAHGQTVLGWQQAAETDGESELCLWSAERQAKDDAIVERQRKLFEEGLEALHAGLSKKGCTKDWAKVVERVGKLRKSCPRVSGQYQVDVLQAAAPEPAKGPAKTPAQAKAKAKPRAQAVRWERTAQHAASDLRAGTYVLRTSHADWDAPRLAETYWRLSEVEATFRSLKGEIGLRPIWHVKQDRIRAHLFLAVLAYHGVHLLRTLLQRQGIHTSWAGIRNRLAGWMRVTTTMQTNAGELVSIRQDTLADAEEAALARAVGIEPQLHRQRRRTRLRQLPES